MAEKKFYRYELQESGGEDDSPDYDVYCLEFYMKRETECGYWIARGEYDKPRFILKAETRKKYARETKEKALECYIYRTKFRVGHLERQLRGAKIGLDKAEKLKNN